MGKRLTQRQAQTLIVQRWQLDHSVDAIMVALVMLGVPVKRRDILATIKRYVDQQTENQTYHGGARAE